MAKRIVFALIAILLLARPAWSAVTFKTSAYVQNVSTQSLSASFTGSAGTNRACFVGLYIAAASVTGLSVACGGVTASLVIDPAFGGPDGQIFCAVAPASGATTATASWSSAATQASLVAIQVEGADQATPCNHSTSVNFSFGTSQSLSITSTSGDLTCSMVVTGGADGSATVTAPITLQQAGYGGGATGTGTGTETHQWNEGVAEQLAVVGANFKAAAGGGGGAVRDGLTLLRGGGGR